jgi:hypothetical protein
MVTIQTADNVLKSFYLNAITDALNMQANPLLAQFQRTSANIVGKDAKKAVRYSVSGGIGAGTETGSLPTATGSEYLQLTTSLKNLYGTIEISDKAIRASGSNEGAFVNLLNDEMQSLVKSASFNFGRMLFGDGTGKITKITAVDANAVQVESLAGFVEGMRISFCNYNGVEYMNAKNRKIVKVDRTLSAIMFDGEAITTDDVPVGAFVCIAGSTGNELTGLGAIFSEKDIYGVDRSCSVMNPYMADKVGEISESVIQKAIDTIEEQSNGKVNFIVCSWGVRRALMEYYKSMQTTLGTMELEGGFKAISFNGIPVIADRFCPAGTMYLLNTNDFKIHQLCDWQWLEGEDGKILKQVPGKPVYTATLVNYADLMCENPSGQGVLKGITEA